MKSRVDLTIDLKIRREINNLFDTSFCCVGYVPFLSKRIRPFRIRFTRQSDVIIRSDVNIRSNFVYLVARHRHEYTIVIFDVRRALSLPGIYPIRMPV